MRLIILYSMLFLANSAAAWEFSPTPLCTLTRMDGDAELRITYDPGLGEYTLDLTDTTGTMPDTALFSIAFEGPRGLVIRTDRHLTDGATLTVKDRGFGNVLNGLEFNQRAVALVGARSYAFDLTTAAPQVQRFRDCETPPAV